MKTVQISLNSIDKVKSFVNAITQFNFDFDLISGRYVIDAKSIQSKRKPDVFKYRKMYPERGATLSGSRL